MCLLFNRCIELSSVPDEWKITYVTPVPKPKGSKSNPNNYRPIAVASPIAKCFESLISSQIKNYFELNNLFSDTQFGFRENKSCELALNTMIDNWKFNLDSKKYVIGLFLDLSKAFDTVKHCLLLKKLSYYNFSSNTIKLIDNYLSNRYNIVKYENFYSEKNSQQLVYLRVPF